MSNLAPAAPTLEANTEATSAAENTLVSTDTESVATKSAPSYWQRSFSRLKNFGKPPRIMGLDLARAIAVLGMVAAHTAFLDSKFNWAEPATWTHLTNGRPSLLFALIGGISIALMTGGTRGVNPLTLPAQRTRLVARGIAIFTVGLVLELIGTSILVILGLYGVLYVLMLPFITWRPRNLVLLSLGLTLAGPAVLALWQTIMVPTGTSVSLVLQGAYSLVVWVAIMLLGLAIGRTNFNTLKGAAIFIVVGLLAAAGAYTASTFAGFSTSEDMTSSGSTTLGGSESSNFGPYVKKESVSPKSLDGYSCMMWKDKTTTCFSENAGGGVENSDSAISTPGLDGGLMEMWSQLPKRSDPETLGQTIYTSFFNAAPHSGGTLEIIGGAGIGAIIIGLSLLAARFLRVLFIPLAALGSMPLTAYTGHVLAIWVAAGPGGTFIDNAFYWWLVAGLTVFATCWVWLVGRGPLERFPVWLASKLAPKSAS